MTTIKDLPKHLRPREKLLEKGEQNLSGKELLAILLRTGKQGKSVLDLAGSLLHKFPNCFTPQSPDPNSSRSLAI